MILVSVDAHSAPGGVFALLSLFYGNGGTRFFLRKAERIEPILKQPGYKGQSMSSRDANGERAGNANSEGECAA